MELDVIRNRRSIRKYTEEKVSEEQIREILEAAFLAPTASNRQEWRFIVIENREMLEKMAEINPYAKMTKDCAFSIIVGYEKGISDKFGVVDCGAAIQNMMLQAHSMGIGSVWCAMMPDSEQYENYNKIIGFPENFATVASVQFGYPAEERETPDRFDEAKVTFIR